MALRFEWDNRKADLNLQHTACLFARLPPSSPTRCLSRSRIPITLRPKRALSTSVFHTSDACSWYCTQNEAIESALLLRDARPAMSEDNMKKQSKRKARTSDQMRPEYDFSKGVRGKHAARYASGTNVVVLAPDVASQFRTADEVNETLRAVARLIEGRKDRIKRQTA